MKNGLTRFDTDNNVLHAHGGWMLEYDGYYYWYGEDRRNNYYVSCYRSKNLTDWECRGIILSTDTIIDSESYPERKHTLFENGHKVNIERPKVLYDEKNNRFVMWAHFENGKDYLDAQACVAVCDTPDGKFTYLGSFNPCGCMSRDCTVFTDPKDGRTYFISASNDNKDLHVYLLTEDLLDVEKMVNNLFIGGLREAPALFYKDNKYYMVSSYCTGWAPNQGKWSCADSIDGIWSELKDFGDSTTYRSQSAFIIKHGDKYYYIGDRWLDENKDYFGSTYIVLEIKFNDNNEPYIEYADECEIF